jgi:hypothetical protein
MFSSWLPRQLGVPMYETMRRLQARGATNRGVCVDADGAMIGPDWSPVERTSSGYRVAPRAAASDVQKVLLADQNELDWLYEQGRRIADALDRGEIALAQIYGLRIPAGDIDHRQLKRLAALAALRKAGFNPDEPRLPAGEPGGGEWTTGDGAGTADASPMSALAYSEEPTAPHLIDGKWPAPTGTSPNPLFQSAQAEDDDENARGGGLLGDFLDLPRQFRIEMYEALRARLREIDPGNSALESLMGPDYSPTQADIDDLSEALRQAQERVGEPPATEWELGWGARGVALERERLAGQRTLPFNAPTIDDFSHDVALSIKSIDLNAPWYGNPLNLSRQIDRYVDKLWAFEGMDWDDIRIDEEQIRGRVLDIVAPRNSGTPAQRRAIAASIERAGRLGVRIFVSYY